MNERPRAWYRTDYGEIASEVYFKGLVEVTEFFIFGHTLDATDQEYYRNKYSVYFFCLLLLDIS